jgi:hypothetical protein
MKPEKPAGDSLTSDQHEFLAGSRAVMDAIRNGQEGRIENPYLSTRREQNLSRIHETLRSRLIERLSTKSDAIQKRLSAWAEDARAEAVGDYLNSILPTLNAEDYAELEDKVVAAYRAVGSGGNDNIAPYCESWMVLGSEPGERDTFVTAWLEARRSDELPPRLWKPAELNGYAMRHLPAVDGIAGLFTIIQWNGLAQGLGNPEWLHLLADWWLADKVKEEEKRLDQESGSMLLSQVRRITVGGSEIGRVTKPLAGLSWAFGGQGETETVRIGEAFDIDVILPRSAGLLREREQYQSLLPLSDGTPENQSEPDHLFALLASQNREMLPIVTGKLALLIMDACRRNTRGNGAIETTLSEITSFINPKPPGPDGKKHRLKLSHYQTTLRALQSMNGIRVVIPGEYVTYSVFDCALPFREARPEEYDSSIFLGLARSFQSAIDRRKDGIFRGEFIFDMTKIMALKKASQLRAGIAAYAEWNKLRPNAGSEPPVIKTTVERWGLRINAFSAGALRAMAGDSSARRKKSEDMKEIESDLMKLEGDKMLSILEMHPKKGLKLQSMPYLEEAYREARAQNPRR